MRNFSKKQPPNIRDEVMGKIRRRKIKIRRPIIYLLEKLGLESAIAATIILMAVLISITSLFFEKTKVHKFLLFGVPGLKIFFLTLPYDYLILFLVAVGLTWYLTKKLMSVCGNCKVSINRITSLLVALALMLGIFFGLVGLDRVFKGWLQNKIPGEIAITGKVLDLDFSQNEILILDNENNIIKLYVTKDTRLLGHDKIVKGKYIQAVGWRDQEGDSYRFHADQINCCDEY